jgi:hypothetical protein
VIAQIFMRSTMLAGIASTLGLAFWRRRVLG